MDKKYINDDIEIIDRYFKDIKNIKVSSYNEDELFKRIREDNCQNSINILVEKNLKFVVKIAKEYQGYGLSLGDLINEGNYGLIKAVYRFNPEQNCKFISYAVWWIRQNILFSLSENAKLIRLPITLNKKINKLLKQINQNYDNYNKLSKIYDEFSNLEILNISKPLYLDQPINHEDNLCLIDTIECKNNDDNSDDFIHFKKELDKTLSILNSRERDIIEYYFGLNNKDELILEDIGVKYNISKERVRQIKERAIRKLRNNAENLFNFTINEV